MLVLVGEVCKFLTTFIGLNCKESNTSLICLQVQQFGNFLNIEYISVDICHPQNYYIDIVVVVLMLQFN